MSNTSSAERTASSPLRSRSPTASSSRSTRGDGLVSGPHRRFLLRSYVEHKSPENLRLHVFTGIVGWLALTTALSQVPLPLEAPALANLGAVFVALSVAYWLPADILV